MPGQPQFQPPLMQSHQPYGAQAAGAGYAPPAPPKRPWFKKKRFVIPGALLVLAVIGGALSGGEQQAVPSPGVGVTRSADPATSPAATASSVPPTSPQATTQAPSETPTTEVPVPSEINYFDDRYGTFEVITKSGKGDSVIEIPAGAEAGLVTATHKGSANFVIQGLDAENEMSDLLVNEIGSYSSVTDFGLTGFGGAPSLLQITADGSWTVEISPISKAPALGAATSGKGDAVYTYDEAATAAAVTHKGSANFVVFQVGSGFPGLLVNEIGAYDGTVPFKKGPAVIVIKADGAWTINLG